MQESTARRRPPPPPRNAALMRRGRLLEAATLALNLVGIVVLAIAAQHARSVALVGFGLDSLIEIGASTVVSGNSRGATNNGNAERYA